MNIPKTLRAGDTWSWRDSLADYPATTWTLKYSLWRYGQSVQTITASADGADFVFSVPAATTIAYAAGVWNWTAYAEKGSGSSLERYTIAEGTVKILAAVFAATATDDLRTHAQKMLDAIEAVLEGRATQAQASITINGKTIAYMRYDELLRLRSYYLRELGAERGTSRNVIRIKFGGAR